MNRTKNHRCRDKCARISGRGDKRRINCFGCGELFYTHCLNMNLDILHHKSFFQPNSLIQLICTSCYESLSTFKEQQKQQHEVKRKHSSKTTTCTDNTNQVTPAPLPHTSQASDNSEDTNDNNNKDTTNQNLSNVILNMSDKITSIEMNIGQHNSKNDTINYKQLIDHIMDLHAKFDTRHTQIKNDLQVTNEIASKLDSIVQKIDCIAPQNKNKNQNQNKTLLNKALLNAASDPLFEYSLNDSMSSSLDPGDGRPSIIFKQTVDESILDIMKNSEDTTWKTLDIIHNQLKENGEVLNTIKELISSTEMSKKIDTEPKSIRSPLMETVVQDTIDIISTDIAFIKSALINPNKSIDHQQISASQQPNETNSTGNLIGMRIESSISSADELEVSNNSVQRAGENPFGMIIEPQNSISSALGLESGPTYNTSFNEMENHVIDILDQHETPKQHEIFDWNSNTLQHQQQRSKAPLHHHFHVSPFDPSKSEEDIRNFIVSNGIPQNEIEVKKLIGRSYNLSTLTFISFKISCSNDYADQICRYDFWQNKVLVQPFEPRFKNSNSTSSDLNFMRQKTNRIDLI